MPGFTDKLATVLGRSFKSGFIFGTDTMTDADF